MGNNIKKIRKLRGMTGDELAAKVSYSNITALENGDRKLKTDMVMKIAEALECSIEDILSDNFDENELKKTKSVFDDDKSRRIHLPNLANIRLRNIKNRKATSQQELADLFGFKKETISQIESGKMTMTITNAEKIANYLNCTLQDLTQGGDMVVENKYIDAGKNVYDENGKLMITIPMYDIVASAGSGIETFNEDITMRMLFDMFIETTNLRISPEDIKNHRFSIIKAEGDSMSDFINDGNLLLIDHAQNRIENYKQIMVFRSQSNRVFVKEVCLSDNGKLNIISYNPEYRSYKEITEEQMSDAFDGEIFIIGKVVWSGGSVSYWKRKGGAFHVD